MMSCHYILVSFVTLFYRIYPNDLEIKDTTDTPRTALCHNLHLDIDSELRLRTKAHFVFIHIIGSGFGTFSSFDNKTLIIDIFHTKVTVRSSLMIIAPIIKYV